MTSPRLSTLRSFAFISVTLSPEVSSISISQSARRELASAIFSHDSSESLPERSSLLLTSASLESIRETSCSALISRENTQTFFFVLCATFVAILSANDVLPIPGRAPISTRSELPIPTSTLSMPENPVGVPCAAAGSVERV